MPRRCLPFSFSTTFGFDCCGIGPMPPGKSRGSRGMNRTNVRSSLPFLSCSGPALDNIRLISAVPHFLARLLKMDWQPCTNCCLEITRQADRDKLIGTPTILPVHARAGRGRAEAGHTRKPERGPLFSILGFGALLFGLALIFPDEKKFLQMIACTTFRACHIELAAATDQVGSDRRLRLDFTRFDCVDNCNFDKIRTSDCAVIAAGKFGTGGISE
jgi:hypothetical protein